MPHSRTFYTMANNTPASSNNPFAIAQAQFDEAAEMLGLEPAMRALLRWPRREYQFTIPVKMDDGSTEVFHGYRVQYNDARGPCKGGLRWHLEETIDTVRALAAWMTWKTSVVDIPLGGGKGGVTCNPKNLSDGEKERLARGWMRVMARELGFDRDVPAPDVYTTPQIMAWMMDEYEVITGKSHPAVITGKPIALGGSQGRGDATARGGVLCVGYAAKRLGLDPTGTYAIQGFGNAGQHAALLHPELLGGGKLLAVSDTSGAVYNPDGLDPQALVTHKLKTGQVAGFPRAQKIDPDSVLELDVDILYPSALENVITRQNAPRVQAKLICELANGPTTPNADKILHERGIHVIPDFLANAGGVTVSYFEQVQGHMNYYWSLKEVHEKLDYHMSRAYRAVHDMHDAQKVHMRLAAYLVAVSRVADAVKLRGWI
jgi:glutamate dehydrogenase (NAD(P)+)